MKIHVLVLFFLTTTCSAFADETADKARPILDEVEKGLKTLQPGDIPAANKLIRRAKEAWEILKPATTKDADWVKPARRFQALVKDITAKAKQNPDTDPGPDTPDSSVELGAKDRNSMRFFNRDFDRFNRILQNTKPPSFQSKQVVADFKSRLNKIRNRYNVFQDKNHPLVKEAAKKIAQFEKTMNEKMKKGTSMSGGLGDWKGNIKTFYVKFGRGTVGKAISLKLSKGNGPNGLSLQQIRTFAANTKFYRNEVKLLGPYLDKVLKQTHIRDRQNKDYHNKLRSLQGRIRSIPKEINTSISSISNSLERVLKSTEETPQEKWDSTTRSYSDKLNYKSLLGDRPEDFVRDYVKGKDAAVLMIEMDAQFNAGKNKARYETLIKEFDARIKSIREGAVKALSMVRMPRAKNTRSDLESLATRLIKELKSGPQSWERLVISRDLEETSRERSYTKDNLLYRISCTWKSFQVALAYEENGKYYIYHVLFKYNIRGLPGDTLNKWFITSRGTFKSKQILKGNIHKTDSYWPHE